MNWVRGDSPKEKTTETKPAGSGCYRPVKETGIKIPPYQFLFLQLDYEEAKNKANCALTRVMVCSFIGDQLIERFFSVP